MKFKVRETRRGNRYALVGIRQNDIYFSNLAAREQPGSPYKPKHVIGIWLNGDDGEPDSQMAHDIASFGFNVKSITKYEWLKKGSNDEEKERVESSSRLKKEYMETILYFLVFTAYPKKDPKIVKQTTAGRENVSLASIDSTRVQEMGIEWSEYIYMSSTVASVDYLLVLADESAAENDSSYLDVVYGHPDVEIIAEDDNGEEVPFI